MYIGAKVTLVSLCPTDAAEAAERPALTPELLAASGARYSRNKEGLEAILARIDPKNRDKSVDSIFRMIDYGHQSIADMAPVALFIDGVSLWLAYYLWTLSPTAGGQESSTRYIRLSADGLIPPERLGIPSTMLLGWQARMQNAFDTYQKALAFWENLVEAHPDLARIPRTLQADSSEKAQKAVQRMQRNYAFDRARYFLPVAAQTNVMLVQSARAWVTVVQHLLSHPLPEAQSLGIQIRDELGLATPRLLRHATEKDYFVQGIRAELLAWQAMAGQVDPPSLQTEATRFDHAPSGFLQVFPPESITTRTLANDLTYHTNRYAHFGADLRRTAVRFGWEAVAFAEIRDLNRHRTGTKHCPLVPMGFYYATDELPVEDSTYLALGQVGREASAVARQWLSDGDFTGIYHTLLGTQFPFEHTTTADKFIYEAELRTGTGAHYRYADHLREILHLWYEQFPETKGLILEGSAEPE
jgi:thymidylate synthase ThyX